MTDNGWRTSSYSSNGERCVEVAPAPGAVRVRHSKLRADGVVEFGYPDWAAFVVAARTGTPHPAIDVDGEYTLVRWPGSAVQLRFDQDEWTAFRSGAADGEFDFRRSQAR